MDVKDPKQSYFIDILQKTVHLILLIELNCFVPDFN